MSVTRCDNCGAVLFVTTEPSGNWKQDQVFESTSNPFGEMTVAGSWSKTTPHARLEPRDILTSLLDSGVTFVFAGIAGGGITYFIGGEPLPWGVVWGFVEAGWRYFDGMSMARGLTSAIEEWASKEPDKPKDNRPQKAIVRAEYKDDKGEWAFDEYEIDPEKLATYAGRVVSGILNFSEKDAARDGITQTEFNRLKESFLLNGFARRKNDSPNSGMVITHKGRAMLRAMATTPLPQNNTADA